MKNEIANHTLYHMISYLLERADVPNEDARRDRMSLYFALMADHLVGAVAVYEFGDYFRALYASDSLYRMLGCTREEYQERHDRLKTDFVHPDDRAALTRAAQYAVENDTELCHSFRARRSDGVASRLSVRGRLIWKDGPRSAMFITMTDVTGEPDELFSARRQLQQETRYRAAVVSDALVVLDVDLTCDIVLRCMRNTLHAAETPAGAKYSDILRFAANQSVLPAYARDFSRLMSRENLLTCFDAGRETVNMEIETRAGSGRVMWVFVTMHLFTFYSHVHAAMYVRDIDEQKRQALALEKQATHDDVTGLYNRAALARFVGDRLNDRLQSSRRDALLLLGMDDMTDVGNRCGHDELAQLLKTAAGRITALVRAEDPVARIVGGEFAVYLTNVTDISFVMRRCRELRDALCLPYGAAEEKRVTLCHIGAALSGEHGNDFDTLLRNADRARYAALLEGGERCSLYVSRAPEHR